MSAACSWLLIFPRCTPHCCIMRTNNHFFSLMTLLGVVGLFLQCALWRSSILIVPHGWKGKTCSGRCFSPWCCIQFYHLLYCCMVIFGSHCVRFGSYRNRHPSVMAVCWDSVAVCGFLHIHWLNKWKAINDGAVCLTGRCLSGLALGGEIITNQSPI